VARNGNSGNSRISAYTKLDVSDTDVAKQPQQPEPDAKKSLQVAGTEMSPSSSDIIATANTQSDVTAESPYVPIPAAGCDLPISPYSCIEQTANDSAVMDRSSLPTDANVRPQETVIAGTEGTKCDGYVPWSSTQPSA